MTPLQKRLAELGACKDAIEWVGSRTLKQAIADCDRADWLMWLQMRMACEGVPGWPNPREVVSLLLEYVPNFVLPFTHRWAAGEDIPRSKFETYSDIGFAAHQVNASRPLSAAISAGNGASDLHIMQSTIRERLRRGRTLGRKVST